jgi:hypothetical protein
MTVYGLHAVLLVLSVASFVHCDSIAMVAAVFCGTCSTTDA